MKSVIVGISWSYWAQSLREDIYKVLVSDQRKYQYIASRFNEKSFNASAKSSEKYMMLTSKHRFTK